MMTLQLWTNKGFETLERGAAEFGYPKTFCVYNGLEFFNKVLDLWA